MKISLKKYLIRAGTDIPRKFMRKRPWLGLFLIVAASACLYFKPSLPDPPFPGFPGNPENTGKTQAETPAAAPPSGISGRVTRVSDGDSLTLKTADGEVKVRLFGLDAPELKQARGRESKKYLSRLVHGREVRVEVKNRDQYGRVVGRVFIGDQVVDRDMIAAGQAWVYEIFCRDAHCSELRQLQARAKADGQGLWQDKNPEPPWVWRKKNPRQESGGNN